MSGWLRWVGWRLRLLFHRRYRVQFDGGRLIVYLYQCDNLDLSRLRIWANAGYRDMRQVWGARVPHGTHTIVGIRNLDAYGKYDSRAGIIKVHCGDENVARHEMLHRLAHMMRLPHWRTIDHPDGHDIAGTPRVRP